MAKSISVLLMVLAVAVFFQADHKVSSRSIPIPVPFDTPLLPRLDILVKAHPKLMEELREKPGKVNDGIEVVIKKFGEEDKEGHYSLMAVTAIEVGQEKLEKSEGSVILMINSLPFLFLHEKAYGLLKNEFMEHQLNTEVRLLCTTDSAPKQVALVYTGKDANQEMLPLQWRPNPSYGTCLGVLLWPFA